MGRHQWLLVYFRHLDRPSFLTSKNFLNLGDFPYHPPHPLMNLKAIWYSWSTEQAELVFVEYREHLSPHGCLYLHPVSLQGVAYTAPSLTVNSLGQGQSITLCTAPNTRGPQSWLALGSTIIDIRINKNSNGRQPLCIQSLIFTISFCPIKEPQI